MVETQVLGIQQFQPTSGQAGADMRDMAQLAAREDVVPM